MREYLNLWLMLGFVAAFMVYAIIVMILAPT